ncbi:allophanate hydrolase subunit 1 [Curtobacterium sp. MCBA15_001]|uniref:5-oxoprolinase subunit B family protein n=1 Tax=Curtobacterium sp. MCBA15_001 TaxID=1898731 RepID=UPI0008DD1DA1|nr:allophanate hydrolase subunit 1 [Curtobacterium sp. MCBA15_001]OIH96497.1 allophanate hydrolase [Curtobacterium sp. MCBA15_001]
MAPVDVREAGTAALLVTFDTLDQVVAFRGALLAARVPGVTEVVSGARTLLVRFDHHSTDAGRVRAALGSVRPEAAAGIPTVGGVPPVAVAPGSPVSPVAVPVTYDGEDLDAVAALTGMSVEAFVTWHTGQVWTSAFCGFAPGFSYLTGTEPPLDLPRRASARTVVPSGSVALAGEFSAVYPRASPGGWQLIGRTDVQMWSLDRDPPALAPAGTPLRFVVADR